jgi:hypothetical protein
MVTKTRMGFKRGDYVTVVKSANWNGNSSYVGRVVSVDPCFGEVEVEFIGWRRGHGGHNSRRINPPCNRRFFFPLSDNRASDCNMGSLRYASPARLEKFLASPHCRVADRKRLAA